MKEGGAKAIGTDHTRTLQEKVKGSEGVWATGGDSLTGFSPGMLFVFKSVYSCKINDWM
jgi:hypothetical protein